MSRTLRQALLELGHDVYLFARTGGVYGQPMHETTGEWDVQPRFDHATYEIAPGTLLSWARYHHLNAVVFNEEYSFDLPAALKQAGIKTISYMDYLGRDWRPLLRHYDQLWTATHRTEAILQDWGKGAQTQYIGWGVPLEMFGNPALEAAACRLVGDDASPPYDFFSNQGWLGINGRKGIIPLLQALEMLAAEGPRAHTLIHAQVPYDAVQSLMGTAAPLPTGVEWRCETVPPPGLYACGRIVIQPSLLEGLGLSVVESMVSGRPTMTTDAPPMNEFVTPDTGWLVPVERWTRRQDPIVFPEAHVSVEGLAKAMHEALLLPAAQLQQKAEATMARAHMLFDWEAFKGRLAEGLGRGSLA